MATLKRKIETKTNTEVRKIDSETGESFLVDIVETKETSTVNFTTTKNTDFFWMFYARMIDLLKGEKLRRAALRVFAWILQNYSSLSSDISIVKHIKDKIASDLGLSPVSIKEYLKELENEDMLIKTGRACFKLNPKYVWQGSSDKRDLAINVLIKEGKFDKMYPEI